MGVRPFATAIAGVIGAGLFGLLLPLAFAGLDNPALALLWLALSLCVCVCLLFAARPIARAVAAGLARLVSRTERSTWSPHLSNDLARLLIAGGYVVLLQAILRHPLVGVFGVEADPFIVEAVTGTLALLIVLALLSWTYAVAKPLLEALATNLLDATVATAATGNSGVPSRTGPSATILAPRASAIDPGATVVSPTRLAADDAPTQLATDAAVTIRVEPPSDPTEVSG